MPTVVVTVVATDDDAREANDDTNFSVVANFNWCGNNTKIYDSGLRFISVPIPAGAQIDSAVLKIHTANVIEMRGSIYGEDEDYPNDYLNETDVTNRTRTTANVAWSADLATQQYVDSPDISTVIQEIIDRSGWASMNALGLILDGDDPGVAGEYCAFRARDDGASTTPTLTVVYSIPNIGDAVAQRLERRVRRRRRGCYRI